MKPIDLHLVSWNRPKMTELVIKTIHRNTERKNFRLVVLDNASEKSTVDMLQKMYDNGLIDEFVPLATNLGLEAARNLLLKNCTQSDYFVCIDNDCLPPKRKDKQDWLTQMHELMQKYEDYAAISMRTQVMIGTGNIFEHADMYGDEIVPFPHPGGSFRIMSTPVTFFVGGWGRGAPGRGQEEKYICGKLHEAGYQTAFASQIECLHLFGTREENPTDRWGYPEDSRPEDTGHSDISHPALTIGDSFNDVVFYSGQKLTKEYFHG